MAQSVLQLFVDYVPQIRKALVAGFVTAALGLVALVGISGDMTVNDALAVLGAFIVNAVLTWAVPNKGSGN